MAGTFRKKKFVGRPPDPDEGWGDEALDHAGAVSQCHRILDKIWKSSATAGKTAFVGSVEDGVSNMAEGIKRLGRVTRGQLSALNNWERGIDKCLKTGEEKGGGHGL